MPKKTLFADATARQSLIDYLNYLYEEIEFPDDANLRGEINGRIFGCALPEVDLSFDEAKATIDRYFETHALDLSLGRVPEVQKPAEPHWITVDKARKAFWIEVNDACKNHGLKAGKPTDTFIHAALEADHIEDYDGTREQAVSLIKQALQEQYPIEQPAAQPASDFDAEKKEIAKLFRDAGFKVSAENFEAATGLPSYDAAIVIHEHEEIVMMIMDWIAEQAPPRPAPKQSEPIPHAPKPDPISDDENPFKPASKESAFLRMALCGPAGSGKTYTALNIASNLGKKIAFIDTERGSARKYAGLFKFDVLELKDYDPATYVKAIKAAEKYGYDVLIVDSLTHAWSALLDWVDKRAKSNYSGNSFVAWKDANPKQAALVDAMLDSQLHLIGTMRSKMEYVLEKDERTGKTSPKKVGLAPVQREGLEYEFDIVGEINIDSDLVITKSRCTKLKDVGVFPKAGREVATIITQWLTE